ncbi:hypothetical protein N7467_011877, partial [Penicillium canescens]
VQYPRKRCSLDPFYRISRRARYIHFSLEVGYLKRRSSKQCSGEYSSKYYLECSTPSNFVLIFRTRISAYWLVILRSIIALLTVITSGISVASSLSLLIIYKFRKLEKLKEEYRNEIAYSYY